jgi:Sporulation and spore germination
VIPTYQRVLFWILVLAIVLMSIFLLHGRRQAREKLTRTPNETPLTAPLQAPAQTVRLALADDATGKVVLTERELALPGDGPSRAQALLNQLLSEYSSKNSAHPLESGPAVDDVYLLDLPLHAVGLEAPASHDPSSPDAGAQLAIVNLDGSFADHHPSGIGVEALTVNSIIGTIYANFPRVQEVRFVVDAHPRETLAGHADLTRTYRVTNTESTAPVPEAEP